MTTTPADFAPKPPAPRPAARRGAPRKAQLPLHRHPDPRRAVLPVPGPLGPGRGEQGRHGAVLHLHPGAQHPPVGQHRGAHRVPRRPVLALDAQHRPLRRRRRRRLHLGLGPLRLRPGQIRLPRQDRHLQGPAHGRPGARRHPGHPAVPDARPGRPDQHLLVSAAPPDHQPVRHLPGPDLRRGVRSGRCHRGGPHRGCQGDVHLQPHRRCP